MEWGIVYRGRQLEQLAFPIGGIGTGCVSLNGWGGLVDWEIFNRPGKGNLCHHAFFTLFADSGDGGRAKVLQGPVMRSDLAGRGDGPERTLGYGLPRFRNCEFVGAFPFGTLRLEDPGFPLKVELEAFNPFLPLQADDSGLPCALFTARLTNPGDREVHAKLFANLSNIAGFPECGRGVIEAHRSSTSGLVFRTLEHDEGSPRFGSLALATPWPDVELQTGWIDEDGWWNAMQRFWNHASRGVLEANEEPHLSATPATGSIALSATVAPGQTVSLPIWIVWHNPNFEQYWHVPPRPVWRNYYATLFADCRAVLDYLGLHYDRLETETRKFAGALYGSSLPPAALDAVASQLSVLKSTTCLRLEDGTFYAWEGCSPQTGCCEGTCTHVWNYAQALAYLFPGLERSVREADYRINLHSDGHMTFRMPLPLGVLPRADFHAAGDGQLGGVLKVYREWKISGDNEWLRSLWPGVRLALEYAWKAWDRNRDGLPERPQHNTYDIEFYGPNTLVGSFYLAALRAGEEMARTLGEEDVAQEYRRVFEAGRKATEDRLFNGEFYVQEVWVEGVDPSEAPWSGVGLNPEHPAYPKYQYGIGCLADQLIGQWYARMLGLGDLYDPDHVRRALQSIFRYNFRQEFFDHANVQRIFATNDEQGLVLCTWPHGGRPALPFPYSDEVWPGFEYQVASHMVFEGLLEEARTIVEGTRGRFDGSRRNPWNEFECGNHYARSLASFALLLAYSGFQCHMAEGRIAFDPRVEGDVRFLMSVDSGWGVYERVGRAARLRVMGGRLRLRSFGHGLGAPAREALAGGRPIGFENQDGCVVFGEPVEIAEGETLEVKA
ncbi:MAG: GH116 family glycosyl hydrolase [Fimbriimonadaceae bacterium]